MAIMSSSGMHSSPWRRAATATTRTRTLLLALLAAGGLLLTLTPVVVARGSPAQQEQFEDDRILDLPGQPNGVAFHMYGGYVTIDDEAGRALYYWLQEADPGAVDPNTAPLVLWLNGGPGCSSIGLGAMQELGAFRVHKDGERHALLLNEYAWNKAANILFVDSPAGVGFSYSNTSSDLISGDEKMAQDTYTFLVKWFERFPHYKNREFYIAGESGHFVPQLARQVVCRNNIGVAKPFINFKGMLVSGGLINDRTDMKGMFRFWWHHGLISDESLKKGLEVCPGSSFMPLTSECQTVWDEAIKEQGRINPYTIYAPTCDKKSPYEERYWRPRGRRVGGGGVPPALTFPTYDEYDPCGAFYAIDYLNYRKVQDALHANVSGILQYPWAPCSNSTFKSWTDAASDLRPIYEELIKAGRRVWFFSGDTDSVVPLSSARRSLASLGLPVKTRWYPWYYMAPNEHEEVGGWSVQYEGLTYVTVRGAGHLVPLYRPAQALTLFKQFLKDEPMPAEGKNAILLPSEKAAPFY